MKIALCDDEQVHSTVLKKIIQRWATSQEQLINTYVYESAEAFLTEVSKGAKFDLAFLDIRMGGMSGVELAKLIRTRDMNMIIVFVTSFFDYVLEGYEVSAYRFLVKPVTEKKILETLNAVSDIMKRRRTGSYTISTGEATFSIAKSDIVYFTTDHHYLNVHTFKEVHRIRGKLSQLADEFAKPVFMKCNRGVLLNVEHISCIHKNRVVMINKEVIPLARGYWEEMNQCYLEIHVAPLVDKIVRSSIDEKGE